MGINPDTELQLLEDEFPESFRALQIEAPRALTDKLLAVARSAALQLAAGREVEAMALPRYRPPTFVKGGSSRPGSALSKRRMASERPPPAIWKNTFSSASLEMDAMMPGDSLKDSANTSDFDEPARLKGRDRETWLQRIAELTLQGKLLEVRLITEIFISEFGAE